MIEFFSASSKRNFVIKNILKNRDSGSDLFKGTQLTGLCETRWVERHDSVIKFREALPYIIQALDLITEWTDINSSSKASSLRRSLCDLQFLSSMFSLLDVLSETLPLSRLLQSPSLELKKATDLIIDTITVLEEKHQTCDDIFSKIYSNVKKLCGELDVDIKLPRLAGSQRNRPNYPTTDPEEYLKTSIYIPLLDNVIINDLKSRFTKETLGCFGLDKFIPTKMSNASGIEYNFLSIIKRFSPILGLDVKNASGLQTESKLWTTKWSREERNGGNLPCTALEALEACDKDIFPTINSLLKILCTLPVSVASAERSFSTLRRLKTWMRSRIGEERLSDLCLLHTHREVPIDINNVIDRFANSGNRKLDFII